LFCGFSKSQEEQKKEIFKTPGKTVLQLRLYKIIRPSKLFKDLISQKNVKRQLTARLILREKCFETPT